MKVDLLELARKFLYEEIRKPTAKERKEHSDGKLYYVVTGESGKVLGYIDEQYVKSLSAKEGKKYSPMGAAKRRLSQVEYFKKEEDEEDAAEEEPSEDDIDKTVEEVLGEDSGEESNSTDEPEDEPASE